MPYTANYNLSQPIIGGDIDRWGQEWNDNATKLETSLTAFDTRIDTLEASMTTVLANYVQKNGSVEMTGRLTLSDDPLSDLQAMTKRYGDTNFLTKTGATAQTIAPAVTFSDNITVASTKTATFGGAATFQSTLSCTGAATFQSTMSVTGDLTVADGTTTRRINLGGDGGYFFNNATTDTAGWSTAGSDKVFWNTSTGAFTAAGDVTAFSDARLKTDVETIQNALDLVCAMRGVRYTRIDTGERGVGVIAQEMRDVVPEVVKDGETLSVAYANLVGVLIEAIKELTERVEDLEAGQ